MSEWPNGVVTEDAPLATLYAAHIARVLTAALENRTVTGVAKEASVARSTLYDIAGGKTWPDVVTLARLEHVLGLRLWPDSPPG